MKTVYVITGKGERKFWTKVGVAFVNRNGWLNVKLDSLPVDGELHIRDYVPRHDKPYPEGASSGVTYDEEPSFDDTDFF